MAPSILRVRPSWHRMASAAVAMLFWAMPPLAHAAIQPLDTFITAAHGFNHDLRQAQALDKQRDQEAKAARGKLLPSLDVAGNYTRNAYKAEFPAGPSGKLLTLMPYNQLDASAAVTVPIIDISNWARLHATRALAEGAQAATEQTALSISGAVTMRYYALLGQEGLYQAALHRQDVAQSNLTLVQTRQEVGTASNLDLARAKNDAAQAAQDVATALLQVQLSRRALETLSGVVPHEGGALGDVSLEPEPPLPQWLERVNGALPAIKQADAQQRAAQAGDRAARWGYLPTLSAKASERITNASGLNGGHPTVWAVTANLNWHFDLTLPATEAAQHYAAINAAEGRASAERQAQDQIFQDYSMVTANLAKSAAARSQVAATQLGATWATEKFSAGTITQLELSQAQRDAFSAEAARIQADTDLLYYRAMLRLDAGISPEILEKSP